MKNAGVCTKPPIQMWEANAYNPRYVIEVREHDINGKKVY